MPSLVAHIVKTEEGIGSYRTGIQITIFFNENICCGHTLEKQVLSFISAQKHSLWVLSADQNCLDETLKMSTIINVFMLK